MQSPVATEAASQFLERAASQPAGKQSFQEKSDAENMEEMAVEVAAAAPRIAGLAYRLEIMRTSRIVSKAFAGFDLFPGNSGGVTKLTGHPKTRLQPASERRVGVSSSILLLSHFFTVRYD